MEDFGVGDAAVQALPTEGAQLDLGDVQPRPMLGRVVDLQFVGQALGLGWIEGLIEAGRAMDIELVHNQRHFVDVAIAPVQQRLDEVRPVGATAVIGDGDLAHPASGSTATNRVAVPLRTYSQSHRSTSPGLADRGSRTSPTNCLVASSKHTTGCWGSAGR